MLLLGLPYAPMMGAVGGPTMIARPACIGALVGVFPDLTIFPVEALVFLVPLVVLQQFEGDLIYPMTWATHHLGAGRHSSGGGLCRHRWTLHAHHSLHTGLIEEDLKDTCPLACTSPDGPCAR